MEAHPSDAIATLDGNATEVAKREASPIDAARTGATSQPTGRGRHVAILGTRGIPARHGGFESFAERLALYLATRDWRVTVYCQQMGRGPASEEIWQGVRLVHVPVPRDDAWGTIHFDWKSTRQAAREGGTLLTLGYNTAIFSLLYRLKGRTHLMNMDGLEWQRKKWGLAQRAWLWINERCGCWFANELIADHPAIELHLASRAPMHKLHMIPYGADLIDDANPALLEQYNLRPHGYAIVIARPEPENSILEIVRAFSQRRRGVQLIVLGRYEPEQNAYHRRVIEAASDEVRFLGAIYEPHVVAALRFFARLYVHGHTVGGTNPALVEALGAGCPVLAHDNVFNRWVAGDEAEFFTDTDTCAGKFDRLLADETTLARMRAASRRRCVMQFTWDRILKEYESLLSLTAVRAG